MPNAAQPAAALRDRAERHVFAEIGELPAIERRVLALLELAGADRVVAARDTGLDEDGLRQAAAAGRKALRRARAPLAAGGRCEQAELLLSDRLDGALDWRDGRWLDIHLDRCPRCVEHERLLAEARAELRASFAIEPEETPAPPPVPSRTDERAKLRVVPPPAEEPVEAEAAPLTVPAEPARDLARRAAAIRTAKVVAAVLIVAAVLAAIGFGISQLVGGDGDQPAPWDRPDAPVIQPSPLNGQ